MLVNDWSTEAFPPPPFTPANLSSTRLNQSLSQIPQAQVNPPPLLHNEHQPDHSQCHLLVGHTPQILCNRTVLLPPKPWLGEICVQLVDHLGSMLCQPCHPLLLGQLEDGVLKLFPEFDTTRCDLVDGLPELRANGKNTASRLAVSASQSASSTSAAATMRNFTDELACASLATITRLANKNPSNGMGWTWTAVIFRSGTAKRRQQHQTRNLQRGICSDVA
jgi:hypothetical protein